MINDLTLTKQGREYVASLLCAAAEKEVLRRMLEEVLKALKGQRQHTILQEKIEEALLITDGKHTKFVGDLS